MGKKKFIDKKKAATFELCPRDTSDPRYSDLPGGDKVFLRVDQNPVNIPGFEEEDEEEDNSRFEDAPEELAYGYPQFGDSSNTLPPHVRKEILELGFPDDGYNYLEHIREIKNTGGGSNFYANPKYEVDPLRDVKVYDASRVAVSGLLDEKEFEADENLIYNVADKTVNVKVKKAVKSEVAALLENSDGSEIGSDVEEDVVSDVDDLEEDYVNGVGDLEEDFVIQASGVIDEDDKVKIPERPVSEYRRIPHQIDDLEFSEAENPRILRQIDELFDQVQLNDYGSDSDDNGRYMDGEEEEEEFVDQSVHNLIYEKPKDYEVEVKYMNPADILKNGDSVKDKEEIASAAKINRRCVEYAENFDDEFVEIVEEEIIDERDNFDCESIISTYSNLDNHPGRINAPERAKKKNPREALSVKALSSSNDKIITLHGKERLPVGFLPGKKTGVVKTVIAKAEPVKRKSHGEETKEEKKERKSAVKSERREARMLKKETKELYKGETRRGQRAVAVSGPASIPL